jgi:hypothetical protein
VDVVAGCAVMRRGVRGWCPRRWGVRGSVAGESGVGVADELEDAVGLEESRSWVSLLSSRQWPGRRRCSGQGRSWHGSARSGSAAARPRRLASNAGRCCAGSSGRRQVQGPAPRARLRRLAIQVDERAHFVRSGRARSRKHAGGLEDLVGATQFVVLLRSYLISMRSAAVGRFAITLILLGLLTWSCGTARCRRPRRTGAWPQSIDYRRRNSSPASRIGRT